MVNKVACGLEELTVQEAVVAPGLVGRQTYPWVPVACPRRNAVFPAGGVMMGSVGGGVTLAKASAGGVRHSYQQCKGDCWYAGPDNILERLNLRFGCNRLQFMFILLIDVRGIRTRPPDCSLES